MMRALLLLCLASSLGAQAPDCHLGAKRFDSYLGDHRVGGFTAPRYVHHAVHIALSANIAAMLRSVHMGAVPSAAVGAVSIGIAPHVRRALLGRDISDRRDLVADAVIASEPLLFTLGQPHRSWRAAFLTGVAMVGSYFAVACYASP